MASGADPQAAIGGAGMFAGPFHVLGQCPGRGGIAGHQDLRGICHERECLEVGQRVVQRLGLDQRALDQGGVREQQRAAIRRGCGDSGGADHASRARAVVDDHVGLQRGTELVCDKARDRIGGAAGRIGQDDADRAGDGLRQRWAVQREAAEHRGGELQQVASLGVHRCLQYSLGRVGARWRAVSPPLVRPARTVSAVPPS